MRCRRSWRSPTPSSSSTSTWVSARVLPPSSPLLFTVSPSHPICSQFPSLTDVDGVPGLSQKGLSVEERESVLNTVSDAYAQHIATDTDAEILGTLVESWTACCRALPGLLSEHSRTLIIKGLEHQLISLRQREVERAQEGAEGGDEDDLLELNELAETEASLYFAINSAVKQMLKEQGPAMPVQPFLPFLQLVGAPSTVAKEFALRLLSDIIEGLGEESFGYVGQYLDKVLGALSDEGELFGDVSRDRPANFLPFCEQSRPREGLPPTPLESLSRRLPTHTPMLPPALSSRSSLPSEKLTPRTTTFSSLATTPSRLVSSDVVKSSRHAQADSHLSPQ